MKTFSIKTIDGNRFDVDECNLFGASPVDQMNDRLKVIIVSTAECVRYFNADAIVCIKEVEHER